MLVGYTLASVELPRVRGNLEPLIGLHDSTRSQSAGREEASNSNRRKCPRQLKRTQYRVWL